MTPPSRPPNPPTQTQPSSATTHTDLELRARQKGIPVKVVHNASIMNAVGACGLQLYRFGEAVSIVFFTGEAAHRRAAAAPAHTRALTDRRSLAAAPPFFRDLAP